MRRMVVHAPTKNYNNLFTSLILNQVLDARSLQERLAKGNDATTFVPSDDELLNGFKTAKLVNLQTRGILYLLEAGIRSARCSTALLGFNNYSLEHMMPKKWRNNWGHCATETEARQRDSILLTLGNLAIIPQSLNAAIRDSSWAAKKTGKGANNPGLSICAAGLTTIHDALQKEIWNETEINTRAQWLYEQARSLWEIV
ncbi:MAG: HNH endonuclease, partial [Selenomonadaceae bacterium]|nr:HNH endonuclease [Selenomonadaceae bacterium]